MHTHTKEMKEEDIQNMAGIFKLLSDPTRLKILDELFNTKENTCVGDIGEVVGISPSATSHQLAKLEARNIVVSERCGQMICYSIKKNELTSQLKKLIDICVGH